MDNNIPTFTPPAPTFTPPVNANRNGSCCHFHQNETAVTKCARCGKPICQDCADKYTVNNEEYEGKALCYDCCSVLVAENIAELKKQKRKILFHYIFTFVGMLFGLIFGFALRSSEPTIPWWVIIITTFVGGTLWTFIKNGFRIIWECIKALFRDGFSIVGIIFLIFGVIWGFIKATVISIWGTIQKLFYYTKYLIQTSGFIKSDTTALQEMADYMEYTQVRSQNVGVDLATLMNEGPLN